ncbi:MAG: histidine--tRNA ligase [Methanobacteriaceae archaeon]|nr:histidine--tRNA ligase [Methanobacteriaceae archaeon]
MEFNNPRGTRDFLFEDMDERRSIENSIRSTFESYGFREVKTPIFEDLKLFTERSGEGIKNEIYHFQDKGNRDLALRPELTASIARLYDNNLQKTAKPIKMYYYGSCFRYERPQAGRFRQFWQFGCEVIGGNPIDSEAEIVSMANDALSKLNLDEYNIHIGHLGIIRGILNYFNIDSDNQQKIIASIDKEEYDLLNNLLDELSIDESDKQLIYKIVECKGSIDDLNDLKSYFNDIDECINAINNLIGILLRIEDFGFKDYVVDLSIARGLDYYTGFVFEIYVPSLGAEKQITGGGTYNLNEMFNSEYIESTGFAIGFDRIIEAYHRQNTPINTDNTIDVLIIPLDQNLKSEAIKISQTLRKENISVDIDFKGKKLKKNLSYANIHNIPYVIIIGKKEVENNTVTIKDMNSGNQESITYNNIIKYIKK